MAHIRMLLAQLGEASAYDFMKVRNFPLSLTGTAFEWLTSLPSCSIGSWAELEEKFRDDFHNGVHEIRLSHLTSVHQGYDESVLDFVKRFRDIKNRCFHLMIFERHVPNLVFAGLHSSIREKLEHYEFLNDNQLLSKSCSGRISFKRIS